MLTKKMYRLERKIAENDIICCARKIQPSVLVSRVAMSLPPTQSSSGGDYKTGGNAYYGI
jgi:hypothetical protein